MAQNRYPKIIPTTSSRPVSRLSGPGLPSRRMASMYYRCETTGLLTDEEREWLSTLPGGAENISQQIGCVLEEQHPGAHLAWAQATGGNVPAMVYWLTWGQGPRGILRTSEECEGQIPTLTFHGDVEVCDLSPGNPGRHGYDLQEPTTATPG